MAAGEGHDQGDQGDDETGRGHVFYSIPEKETLLRMKS
jgi:hypothetical protein